jgi:hypothetical protein
MEELPREEVALVVDRLVAELLEAAGVAGPPVDAIDLAQRHLGMIVCLDHDQPQRGRAQRAGGKRHIYLRPEPTPERHQWTVAHEIGEHFKSALLERLSVDPHQTAPMAGESLANLFAYRLLTPVRWFAADAPASGYDVLTLKQQYGTASHEVVAWRLLDLPEPCIITIVDNGRISRRRSNAWPIRRELSPAEKKCQRHVNQHGQPMVVSEGGWTVQGWPVHRQEWKREIMRSIVEDIAS